MSRPKAVVVGDHHANALVDARAILEKLRRDRTERIRFRDLYRAVKLDAERGRAAVSVLERANVLRVLSVPGERATAGRPASPTYEVNAAALHSKPSIVLADDEPTNVAAPHATAAIRALHARAVESRALFYPAPGDAPAPADGWAGCWGTTDVGFVPSVFDAWLREAGYSPREMREQFKAHGWLAPDSDRATAKRTIGGERVRVIVVCFPTKQTEPVESIAPRRDTTLITIETGDHLTTIRWTLEGVEIAHPSSRTAAEVVGDVLELFQHLAAVTAAPAVRSVSRG